MAFRLFAPFRALNNPVPLLPSLCRLVYDGLLLDRSPQVIDRGIEDSTCGSSVGCGAQESPHRHPFSHAPALLSLSQRYHLSYRTSSLEYSDTACDATYADSMAAAGGDSSSEWQSLRVSSLPAQLFTRRWPTITRQSCR